jgi:hypothetical protein
VLALLDVAADAAEGEAVRRLEQKEAVGLSSLHCLHRYQNQDGNEQYKLMKSKPIKGNKLLRHKTFSVDGLTVQRLKNCDCAGCLFFRADEFALRGSRAKDVGLPDQQAHLHLSNFSWRAKLKADKLLIGKRKENKQC